MSVSLPTLPIITRLAVDLWRTRVISVSGVRLANEENQSPPWAGQSPSSANVAKERLRIIVAQERSTRGGPDYLPVLRSELLHVIRKP